MTSSRPLAAGTLAMCLFALPADVRAEDAAAATDDRIVDSAIVERAAARLVQFDVTVVGRDGAIANLDETDFEVAIDDVEVDFFVHGRCAGDRGNETGPPGLPADDSPPTSSSPDGARYLFYFDQHHLTVSGRRRAVELSRELVADLIRDGDRGAIVSSGDRVRVFAGWTGDAGPLLEALDRLESDRGQYDAFASGEPHRIEEVLQTLSDGAESARVSSGFDRGQLETLDRIQAGRFAGASMSPALVSLLRGETERDMQTSRESAIEMAREVARLHRNAERWHTERALARFRTVVAAQLGGGPPPKAVIYFADTLRANPGDHYLDLLSRRYRSGSELLDSRLKPTLVGEGQTVPSYQEVIEEAAAHGVRLYPVLARGLTSATARLQRGGAPWSSNLHAAGVRFRDAEDGLGGLAAETGGRSFLHGVDASGIAEAVRRDLDCSYLISFDPAGLPRDRPLPVRVSVRTPGATVRSRPSIVVRSDSAALVSRLMGAFASGKAGEDDGALSVTVIPTGYAEGRLSAVVQASVPPGQRGDGGDVDIGVSLVSHGSVRQEASRRVSVAAEGIPVILETEMDFPPGPFELTAVAHRPRGDEVLSRRITTEWPGPSAARPSVGPIALVQPARGVFVRGDRVRRSGSWGVEPAGIVRTDLATALIGMACAPVGGWSRGTGLSRRLTGETSVAFPEIPLEPATERCVVFADEIPADTMTSGSFVYEVRVVLHGEAVETASRPFVAADRRANAGLNEDGRRR